MYKTSIIIPVYNVELYIEVSLLSALNQTFGSIEYIIVDDCGTDKSMEIVKRIKSTHPRGGDMVICRHEKNLGLSAARNTGIANSTGEYVFFMDSDDEIMNNSIELLYGKMTEDDYDVVIGNTKLVGKKSIHIKHGYFDKLTGIGILRAFFEKKSPVSACNKLYRKSFIVTNNLKFIDGMLYEDIIWTYNYSKSAKKIAMIEYDTYLYKVRKNSIVTSNTSFKNLDSLCLIKDILVEEWTRDGIDKSLKNEFNRYLSFIKFIALLQILKTKGAFWRLNEYYEKIKASYEEQPFNIFGVILRMPFLLFCVFFKLPYCLYKKL